MGGRWGKALFDFLFGLVVLVLLLIPMAIIALAIKLTSKGPVLFLQERVGKTGRPFNIMKFRTMVPDAEKRGMKITVGKDPRITGVGHFLRKYKLDELPQIFNILKGDMSFVGPRPEVPKYVAHYTPEQRRVLSVKPGVTDLASVTYKRESEILGESRDPEQAYLKEIMPAKLAINLDYVDNMSLLRDLKLIALTVKEVFFGD